MEGLKDHEVLINQSLFKRFFFYQLLDPNTAKIFKWNIYKCIYVVFIMIILSFIIFSLVNFLTETKESLKYIDLSSIIYTYFNFMLSLFKILQILCKSDTVWDLLNVTRADFLSSKPSRIYMKTMYEYREISIKISNYIFRYFLTVFIIWMSFPVIFKIFMMPKDPNQRHINIFNLHYPVSVNFYNQYYFIFYFMELIILTFIANIATMVDIFLISISLVITSQYEVLRQALESVGHDEKCEILQKRNENGNVEELKDVLFDLSNVYIKLKSFYSIIWIIVVTQVIFNSSSMIMLACSSFANVILRYCLRDRWRQQMRMYHPFKKFLLSNITPMLQLNFFMIISDLMRVSPETFPIIYLMMLFSAFLAMTIQLYVYCYLFSILKIKQESLNFGIFSCNWTEMDLKRKKLLFLAMHINNANQLKIQVSPIKIINIEFFAKVMITIYNIVSVMLKTLNWKN